MSEKEAFVEKLHSHTVDAMRYLVMAWDVKPKHKTRWQKFRRWLGWKVCAVAAYLDALGEDLGGSW